jgi:crotonobetainyl-CoA:carnitine CoA-transferase CaiB-like acyl-CoA transferase
MGARFQAINRNKLSVTLELKNSGSRRTREAGRGGRDVFFTNMRPEPANRRAIGASVALNPVYCAIGAYGIEGLGGRGAQ